MSYPRGQMNKRVGVYVPVREANAYGQGSVQYRKAASIWAWVTWTKGARAMHHGDMDVYQSLMVRTDVHKHVDRHVRMEIDGKCYAVDSINISRERNECQITAFEIENIEKATGDGYSSDD